MPEPGIVVEAPNIIGAIAVGILGDGPGVFQEIIPGPVGRRFGQARRFKDRFIVIDQRGVPGEGEQILLILPAQSFEQLGMRIVEELLHIGIALEERIQLSQDASLRHQGNGFDGVPDDIDLLAAQHGGDDFLRVIAPTVKRNRDVVNGDIRMRLEEIFEVGFPLFLRGE